MDLKFYNSVTKGLKLKVRMFRGLISTFAEVTEEQLAGGGRGGRAGRLFGTAHPE